MHLPDSSHMVWDEVVAFWIVLWLLAPALLSTQIYAFVLFRLFDAVKIGPMAGPTNLQGLWLARRLRRDAGRPGRRLLHPAGDAAWRLSAPPAATASARPPSAIHVDRASVLGLSLRAGVGAWCWVGLAFLG